MDFHVNAIPDELHAFAFEQLALELGYGLAEANAAARAKHSVPGNTASARACSHGVARHTGAAAYANYPRQFSIGDYAGTRNEFHLTIDRFPGTFRRFCFSNAHSNNEIFNHTEQLLQYQATLDNPAASNVIARLENGFTMNEERTYNSPANCSAGRSRQSR